MTAHKNIAAPAHLNKRGRLGIELGIDFFEHLVHYPPESVFHGDLLS